MSDPAYPLESDDPLVQEMLAGLPRRPLLTLSEVVELSPFGKTATYHAIKPADPATAKLPSALIAGRRVVRTIHFAQYLAGLVREADRSSTPTRSEAARERRRRALDRRPTSPTCRKPASGGGAQ